jgi:uncharacterized protein YycO
MVEIGDVVFFKKDGSLINSLIADITHSDYTHVGMVVGENKMVEANGFIKTRSVPMSLITGQYEIYRIPNLTDEQKRKIVAYAESKIGTGYDYEKIVGLFIRFEFLRTFKGFDERNRYICSELVDLSLDAGGVHRLSQENLGNVSPSELLRYYKFNLVMKGGERHGTTG